MIDGGFVNAMETSTRRPVTEDGRVFIPQGWGEVAKKIHAASPLVVHTLTGFVDYCQKNLDGLSLGDVVAHVKDPGRVELRAKLEDESSEYRRQTYAVATTEMVGKCSLPFGSYVDAETFYIGLQTGFTSTADRGTLLTLVASIRENSVRETVDDGVAQEVKTGAGVVLVGAAKVPNPVALAPFRTFREIAQPASLFVVRLQANPNGEKPKVALFEADGGGWKLEAIRAVADYLKATLPEMVAVLA